MLKAGSDAIVAENTVKTAPAAQQPWPKPQFLPQQQMLSRQQAPGRQTRQYAIVAENTIAENAFDTEDALAAEMINIVAVAETPRQIALAAEQALPMKDDIAEKLLLLLLVLWLLLLLLI